MATQFQFSEREPELDFMAQEMQYHSASLPK